MERLLRARLTMLDFLILSYLSIHGGSLPSRILYERICGIIGEGVYADCTEAVRQRVIRLKRLGLVVRTKRENRYFVALSDDARRILWGLRSEYWS